MKTKINFLLSALVISVFVLQSCVKDVHQILEQQDDKLLLSKVTGHNDPYGWNNFEFDNNSNYLATYSYGSEHFGWDDYRPIQHVGFYTQGTWDFTYNDFLPDQVIDHSVPGKDQGYWKFYYNERWLIKKTGLAFSTPAGPTEFVFYQYDDRRNLTSLIYGKTIDTPYFKQTYTYDANDNLTEWNALFPTGFKNATTKTGTQNVFYSLANTQQKKPGTPIENRLFKIKEKLFANADLSKITKNDFVNNSPDSNVIYVLGFTIKITSDGKHNPYHQQGRILFYPTVLAYSADLNAHYIALMKSNPIKAEWIQNPQLGNSVAVSNFTYTYNNQGYPITTHEEMNDPNLLLGIGNYTQDRQIEYISNR